MTPPTFASGASPYLGGERRLDWRALVVHAVTFKQARGVLSGAGPLAAIAAVQGRLGGFGLVGIAVLATVASFVFAALNWWRFTYAVGEHQLLTRQGLLSRSDRTVPLDRIRGVDVEASPLHRLFGLAVLRVDAAAGTGGADEAVLDAVSATDARRLRTALLTRRPSTEPVTVTWAPAPLDGSAGPPPSSHPGEPAAPEPARVLARLDPRWLLYAPLVGSYLAVPVALGGTFFRDVQSLPLPQGLQDLLDAPDAAGGGRLALSLAALLALVLLGALVAGAVANWGFVLSVREGNLVAERGLLTRRTVSLERDRVRGYALVAGLGIRLAGAARLTALVTGLGDEHRRGQLLPLGPLRVAEAVAAQAVRRFDTPLRRHPPAARRRRLVRVVGPPLLAAAALWLLDLPLAATVLLGAAALAVPLGLDRYAGLGHAADDAALCVRSGSLVRERVVLERRAVVGWRMNQSWFQRRAGLVTMTACVGAGSGGYDVQDCGLGQGLDLVARVSPGWADPLHRTPAGGNA